MHGWSWIGICRPEKGGLGVKRISDLCSACGIKLVWKFCASHSLWAAWMRNRYLKGKSLWDASVSILGAGTWKHFVSKEGWGFGVHEEVYWEWACYSLVVRSLAGKWQNCRATRPLFPSPLALNRGHVSKLITMAIRPYLSLHLVIAGTLFCVSEYL